MESKFLPIGTVVTLKNVTKDMMITGYSCMSETNKAYDYSACFYPEGMLNQKTSIAFNHDNIDKILFNGFKNDKFEKFSKKMFDEDLTNTYDKIDTFDYNSQNID